MESRRFVRAAYGMKIVILCPPINLYSKPWQHAFDNRVKPMTTRNPHDAIRIYWERSGRPKVEFNTGDAWLETYHPTWNPRFKYRLIGEQGKELKPANFTSEYGQHRYDEYVDAYWRDNPLAETFRKAEEKRQRRLERNKRNRPIRGSL